MLPIPRRLLIHSAEVRTPVSEDCFGRRTYSEGVPLRHIRIEIKEADKNRERDMLNAECGGSALLIYDCANSLPRGFVFRAGQEVLTEGGRFRITSAETLYDENKPHHIEAEMTEEKSP